MHPNGRKFSQSGQPVCNNNSIAENHPWSLFFKVIATPRFGFLFGNGFVPPSRVARWYIFKPKIPNWVNLIGHCNGRCWYILWPFGLS
jgi:hypothetical protein